VANCENNKHGQSITKNVLLNRFWILCKWPLKSEKYSSCNLSGIFSFYNISIAQIFIHLIYSSVLNLMVLRGLAPNMLLFWFLHGSLHCTCVYNVLPYGILNISAIIYYDADNNRRHEQNVSHLYSKCHFHVKHAQLSKQKNSKHSHAFITHTTCHKSCTALPVHKKETKVILIILIIIRRKHPQSANLWQGWPYHLPSVPPSKCK